MSVPTSNVTTWFIEPSLALVDWMYSDRSTPFICCSIGVATDCSIVIASAPVYVVVRLTCGGRICGNCAIGRPSSDTTPSRTVRMAMTIATIGRRMKKLDTGAPAGQFLGGAGGFVLATALGAGGED